MRLHPFFPVLAALALLGCGKSASSLNPAGTDFGEVTAQTYEAEGTTLVFTSDRAVVKTWANMNGAPVSGRYTKTGPEIAVNWDPTASHHQMATEKYRQTGPCTFTRYEKINRAGRTQSGATETYQRTKPACAEAKRN